MSLLDAYHLVNGPVKNGLDFLEATLIQTAFGDLRLIVILHAFASLILFVPGKHGNTPPVLLLTIYLIASLSGQFVTAYLLAIPPEFMLSNLLLPTYVVAWAIGYYTPQIHIVLQSFPFQVISRLVFCTIGTFAIGTWGVDAVVYHRQQLLSHSAVGAIFHGAAIGASGTLVVLLFWLIWTSRDSTRQQPLPFEMAPDLKGLTIVKAILFALFYYVITDPHQYINIGAHFPPNDARVLLWILSVLLEFFGPQVPPYAPESKKFD